MYDLSDFAYDVNEALECLEQAVLLCSERVTHDNWQAMNDYLDNLRKAIKLVEIPEEIEKAFDEFDKEVTYAEGLSDRNSY